MDPGGVMGTTLTKLSQGMSAAEWEVAGMAGSEQGRIIAAERTGGHVISCRSIYSISATRLPVVPIPTR
jgi:hypothetical protein